MCKLCAFLFLALCITPSLASPPRPQSSSNSPSADDSHSDLSIDALNVLLVELETQTQTQGNKKAYKVLKRWAGGLMSMSADMFRRQRDIKKRNSNDVFVQTDPAALVHDRSEMKKAHLPSEQTFKALSEKYGPQAEAVKSAFDSMKLNILSVPPSKAASVLENPPFSSNFIPDVIDCEDSSFDPVPISSTNAIDHNTKSNPLDDGESVDIVLKSPELMNGTIAMLETQGDTCDPDIDPIMILLDWAQFHVELVYEVMEKYIRKLREEEAKQPGFSVARDPMNMSPTEALMQVRDLVHRNFGGKAYDSESEFHLDDSERVQSKHEELAELLRLGKHTSFLEMETQTEAMTGCGRCSTQRRLWVYNILMQWSANICMDKDDKIQMALLEVESMATPPSSHYEPASWLDAVTAYKEECPKDECIHGTPDEDLEYYRQTAMQIEREALEEGYGPYKHLPAPGGVMSESDEWTPRKTLEMANRAKANRHSPTVSGMGTRPVMTTTRGDCGPFFRKAIETMVALAWMTWWSMYYTILAWLKSNTENV